jgi:hypothetical protein
MAEPVERKIRLTEDDRRRLLIVEDLFRFEAPGFHPKGWVGGRRFGQRSPVINTILRWARSVGADSSPPAGWMEAATIDSKAMVAPELADGMSIHELGALVNRGLAHYLQGANRTPTKDGIGRKIAGTERFFSLPQRTLAAIRWEAFRVRKDPRDVLAGRMPDLLESALGLALLERDVSTVTFIADPAFERRYADLEEVAVENGVKASRYVEEAALIACAQGGTAE